MRFKSSGTCRSCWRHLEGEWARAEKVSDRHDLQLQMDAGECWPCQRKRHAAAVEYMRAADDVRLLMQVARARREPLGTWVREPQWAGVTRASEALTAAGLRDLRSTWDRLRRRETWH